MVQVASYVNTYYAFTAELSGMHKTFWQWSYRNSLVSMFAAVFGSPMLSLFQPMEWSGMCFYGYILSFLTYIRTMVRRYALFTFSAFVWPSVSQRHFIDQIRYVSGLHLCTRAGRACQWSHYPLALGVFPCLSFHTDRSLNLRPLELDVRNEQ